MTEYVAGFLFDGKGRVALVRKARPAWQRGRWNGIGGHVEPGETPQQSMVREFREETGFDTFESDWSHRVTLAGGLTGGGWTVHFFRAVRPDVTQDSFLDPATQEEPCYMVPTSPVPADVLPNLHWLIPLCLDDDLAVPVLITDVSDPALTGATVRSLGAAGG